MLNMFGLSTLISHIVSFIESEANSWVCPCFNFIPLISVNATLSPSIKSCFELPKTSTSPFSLIDLIMISFNASPSQSSTVNVPKSLKSLKNTPLQSAYMNLTPNSLHHWLNITAYDNGWWSNTITVNLSSSWAKNSSFVNGSSFDDYLAFT